MNLLSGFLRKGPEDGHQWPKLVGQSFIIKCILDVVLEGFTIYRLLLVLTQRDVVYQKQIIVVR